MGMNHACYPGIGVCNGAEPAGKFGAQCGHGKMLPPEQPFSTGQIFERSGINAAATTMASNARAMMMAARMRSSRVVLMSDVQRPRRWRPASFENALRIEICVMSASGGHQIDKFVWHYNRFFYGCVLDPCAGLRIGKNRGFGRGCVKAGAQGYAALEFSINLHTNRYLAN